MAYSSWHYCKHQILHLVVCTQWILAERMNVKSSFHFLNKSPMIMKTKTINVPVMEILLISTRLDNISRRKLLGQNGE